jgi:chromosome segregation ATPase
MGDVYMSGIVCKGSFALGTACRRCSRCLAESKRWQASQAVHSALNTPSSALKEIRELKAKVVELEKELSAPNPHINTLCKQLAKVTKERADAQARIAQIKAQAINFRESIRKAALDSEHGHEILDLCWDSYFPEMSVAGVHCFVLKETNK